MAAEVVDSKLAALFDSERTCVARKWKNLVLLGVCRIEPRAVPPRQQEAYL